jgi:hypothetical protein
VNETTRKPITTLSFAFSLRFNSVISMFAVAPAGITAPFDPVTASDTVAENRWPTRCVFVHTRVFDARFTVEPAAMEPTARSAGPGPRSTVLPLAVVDLVGAGAGAGAVRVGVLTTVPVERRGAVARGCGACGAGEIGAGATVPAGTSFNCGCTDVSALAI